MEFATLTLPDNGKHNKKFGNNSHSYYYTNLDSTEKLIKYLFKQKKNRLVRLFGAYGVDMSSTDNAIKQVKAIKRHFVKEGGRMMAHYILSIPYNICDNPFTVYQIAWEVIGQFFYGFQVIFAVHENTGPIKDRKNIHVHFVLNSVSALDGHKWINNFSQFKNFKYEIEKLANSYILDRDTYNMIYQIPTVSDDISVLL